MSVCGQTGQAEEDSASEEVTSATTAIRDLYKEKPASKVVRVLTVLAYLLSVSLAAILLSVYYICVWKSPELPPLNEHRVGELNAQRGNESDYAKSGLDFNFTGGGGTPMSEVAFEPSPISITNDSTNTSTSPGAGIDSVLDLTVLPASTTSDILNATSDDIDTFYETSSIT